MSRPVIVQHSFGEPNSGGPIVALGRVLDSRLADKYEFVRMHQPPAARPVDLPLLRRWVSLLRETRPDLVHVRGLGNEGFRGALAARLAGCPRILVSIHGAVRDIHGPHSLRQQALIRVFEPATLRMSTDLATVCHAASRRDFLRTYRSKLIGVVPNGVPMPDLSRRDRSRTRAELGIAPSDIVCVVVGRLTVEKGHLVLANALRRLPGGGRDISLLLVGDGPDRDVIESAYRSVAGVTARFLGRRTDVAAILDASDLFLFPTLRENLSNALLEGMAAGLPVIATAVGGNVEVLEHGGGVLIPALDAEALAANLQLFLGDAELRERLGRRAREVVNENYTINHMIEALDHLYEVILERKGKR